MASVILGDFHPVNQWKVHHPNVGDFIDFTYSVLIDETTSREYSNESKECVSEKCQKLTLATPIVHSIASCINIAYRIVRLVTLSHFWWGLNKEAPYSLKERTKEAGKDLLRIFTTPFAFIGLELAAIYGIFSPYNGRKLYATIERAQYGNSVLAPCFQPDPE